MVRTLKAGNSAIPRAPTYKEKNLSRQHTIPLKNISISIIIFIPHLNSRPCSCGSGDKTPEQVVWLPSFSILIRKNIPVLSILLGSDRKKKRTNQTKLHMRIPTGTGARMAKRLSSTPGVIALR